MRPFRNVNVTNENVCIDNNEIREKIAVADPFSLFLMIH